MSNVTPIQELLVNLPDSVKGLNLIWNSVTTLFVTTGTCRDSTNTFDITSSRILTLDTTISGLGGLDTGTLLASHWYQVYIIADSSGVRVPGVILSISYTPTMPFGYDIFRRIGCIRTDGSSNIIAFFQTGLYQTRYYQWDGIITLLSFGTENVFTTLSLIPAVPPTVTKAKLNCYFTSATVSNSFSIKPSGSAAVAGSCSITGICSVAAANQDHLGFDIVPAVVLNTPVVDYTVTDNTDHLYIYCAGFEENI